MYWIYLILFIVAIFTPEIVRNDLPWIQEEKAEELMILALGVMAFLIFISKEKQLSLQVKSKRIIQKEASLASKDLTDTYSYIGEINRKIEILKDIALGLVEKEVVTEAREMELYNSIIHAIQMFTKSRNVLMRFINKNENKIVKEIGGGKGFSCQDMEKEIRDASITMIENERSYLIKTPKAIKGIYVCIYIEKSNASQKLEDPDMIKALASQALFLYNFTKNSRN